MRQWAANAATPGELLHVLTQAVPRLGESHFEQALLDSLYPLLPAASCAVYRTGPLCPPVIYMSASHGVPDTTRDCWRAYLSGPYVGDNTLCQPSATPGHQVSHITAQEVPPEHRAKVYEAHGMAERVSVVEPQGDGALFAINFYRHQHQRPFSDAQIADFTQLAPALLALAHKHLLLRQPLLPDAAPAAPAPARDAGFAAQAQRVQRLHPGLTLRECEVCAGMLQGLTLDGIACQLGLGLPTVKTYRQRAFARLGIHFRNELFARVLAAQGS